MLDLFGDPSPGSPRPLAQGAWLLPGFAAGQGADLQAAIAAVAAETPFRQMETPGGGRMSVAMTSCGRLGWLTDRSGYRYGPADPVTGQPWPVMPDILAQLAAHAAGAAGYPGFQPDSCLINRYEPGARMGLHQDRDEADMAHPIVSVSLGLPAIFLFGGRTRTSPTQRLSLHHGDIVVWGGASRRFYHGVAPVTPGEHPLAGPFRYNLTFRRAG
jgi:alkylated DNA repair protein (DNA oxidative demethylase)